MRVDSGSFFTEKKLQEDDCQATKTDGGVRFLSGFCKKLQEAIYDWQKKRIPMVPICIYIIQILQYTFNYNNTQFHNHISYIYILIIVRF